MPRPDYPPVTNRETRRFGELVVSAEFSDTDKGFFYRLVCGNHRSEWSGFYEGFAVLAVGKRRFALFTQYWTNKFLKTEEPLEITEGEPQ